jgi:hypothetical protein
MDSMKQFKASRKQIDKLKKYLNGKDTKPNNVNAGGNSKPAQANK